MFDRPNKDGFYIVTRFLLGKLDPTRFSAAYRSGSAHLFSMWWIKKSIVNVQLIYEVCMLSIFYSHV